MKAKVIETKEIIDVVTIIDRQYGYFISYWDVKNGKEYSRFELDFNVYNQTNDETVTTIDWEQRRYEIAKEFYLKYSDFPREEIAPFDAKASIKYADILIEELKSKKENE